MRRRQFVSLLGGVVLAPLTALPVCADLPAGCGGPVARDNGWHVASIDDDKLVDRVALYRMADRVADSNVTPSWSRAAAVWCSSATSGGADEIPGHLYGSRVETIRFDADTPHNVKSVSKSVASLAVGIAIDRGLIPSIDEPIWTFFPGLADLRSAERQDIRLSHVLGMSMRLGWVEATPATGDFDHDEAWMHLAWAPCH